MEWCKWSTYENEVTLTWSPPTTVASDEVDPGEQLLRELLDGVTLGQPPRQARHHHIFVDAAAGARCYPHGAGHLCFRNSRKICNQLPYLSLHSSAFCKCSLWVSRYPYWLSFSIDPLPGSCNPVDSLISIRLILLGECPRRGYWRVSRVRDRARLKGRDSRVTTHQFTFPWVRGISYRVTRTSKVAIFSHLRYFESQLSRFQRVALYYGELAGHAASAWAAKSPVAIEATSAREHASAGAGASDSTFSRLSATPSRTLDLSRITYVHHKTRVYGSCTLYPDRRKLSLSI